MWLILTNDFFVREVTTLFARICVCVCMFVCLSCKAFNIWKYSYIRKFTRLLLLLYQFVVALYCIKYFLVKKKNSKKMFFFGKMSSQLHHSWVELWKFLLFCFLFFLSMTKVICIQLLIVTTKRYGIVCELVGGKKQNQNMHFHKKTYTNLWHSILLREYKYCYTFAHLHNCTVAHGNNSIISISIYIPHIHITHKHQSHPYSIAHS